MQLLNLELRMAVGNFGPIITDYLFLMGKAEPFPLLTEVQFNSRIRIKTLQEN